MSIGDKNQDVDDSGALDIAWSGGHTRVMKRSLSRILQAFQESDDPYFYFWLAFVDKFEDLGLTQAQFADKLSIEQSYLSRILSGKKVPARDTQTEMARALGTSVREMEDLGRKKSELYYGMHRAPEEIQEKYKAFIKSSGYEDEPLYTRIPYMEFPGIPKSIRPKAGALSHISINTSVLRTKGMVSAMMITQCYDDSMEPTIPLNSWVVVDTSRNKPIHNHVYLLAAPLDDDSGEITDWHLMFARFFKAGKDFKDKYVADNEEVGHWPDVETEEPVIEIEAAGNLKFKVIGRACWAFSEIL